jgi:hypothetical protein
MHACTHVYKHLPAWACLGHFWRPDIWPKTAHRAPLSEKILAPRGRSGRGGLSLCPAHTPICFRLPLSSPAFVSRFRLPLSSPAFEVLLSQGAAVYDRWRVALV